MKKINKHQKLITIIKNNKRLLIGLIIGIILSATTVYGITYFSADEVSYDDTKASGTLGATNVQTALNKIYEKVVPTYQLGDYISMVPDSCSYTIEADTITGYTSDQTISPCELTLWRVININNNGTVEAVSEYVSSTNVYFRETTGYANFVGGLQTIAAQYAKEGVTIGTRMMGYDGQTLTISDTSAFDGTSTTAPSETSTPDPTTGTGEEYSGGVLGDTLYLKDYQLVQNVYQQDNNTTNYCDTGLCAYQVGTTTKAYYWLASRDYSYSSGAYFSFSGRFINPVNNLNSSDLRIFNISSWIDNSGSKALRPIITLKSGITSSRGDGSKSNPYTLS